MNTQKTTQPNQSFEGNRFYYKAANYAFAFIKAEKMAEALQIKRAEIESKHDNNSNFWRVASFAAVFVAMGLGVYEVYNIQASLSGMLSNGSDDELSLWLFLLLGVTLSIIGMLLGHSLNAETDHITGKKKLTFKWWICLVLSIGYIYMQYYLASAAGEGIDADSKQVAHSQSVVVVFIAIAELVLGYLFLTKAIEYLFSYRLKILMSLQRIIQNRSAKNCCQTWDYYIGYVEYYNHRNPFSTISEKVETENIKKAKSYFKDTSGYTFI
jgi:hypothetical protein